MTDLKLYQEFVTVVTSEESKHNYAFLDRFDYLSNYQDDKTKINTALLLTAAMGLSAESGEFNEIIKKMFFQGKPLNEENVFHMKRELGDIMWYWVNACTALGLDPNDVINENVKKLESRYPGGKFDAWHSENRKSGDL
ncbi:pyrophosphatase [bacterium]|nr:pyrophosphatase [bacterium]